MTITSDYLIRGIDYLENQPGFQLVGRFEDLQRMTKVLMRKHANSILLIGPGGVGCSALCQGLQLKKKDADAPFDIVSKRFYWLDTDGLFSSGDPNRINQSFEKSLRRLSYTPETVLIIDDMRDFIDACRNNGCSNLINALMREIKSRKFQVILETRDSDLELVLKCHSDMHELYTLLDINEPDENSLIEIIKTTTKNRLEKHHRISASEDAILTAITLTNKYRVQDFGLSRAQPERSLTLLDRALTSYRLKAHAQDPELAQLEQQLSELLQMQSSSELNQEQAEQIKQLQDEIQNIKNVWDDRQNKIKNVFKEIATAEQKIRELEDEKESQIQAEQQRNQRILKEQSTHEANTDTTSLAELSSYMEQGNLGSTEVVELNNKITRFQQLASESKLIFERLTSEINDSLELNKESVLAEFSSISGVPVSKLTQDEKAKLANLQINLNNRVFGQEMAVSKLADQVLISRAGLQSDDKPQGAFLYMGPSGVGKTELAKALAAELLDDEKALLRFDMSEYQEKHALAKLIGAPPGYEGYEAGGILTNEMRRNPRRIVLLDEIEKAHPDIFLILLQVLDDARLTDNRGLTVSFSESIILMTTNIGKDHFIAEPEFEISQKLALSELDQQLPPELLNRFNGRQNIICFKPLQLSVIERIARREIDVLKQMVNKSRAGLDVEIKAEALTKMCEDNYQPVHGARGITGYIQTMIKPAIAKTLLFEDDVQGTMIIEYHTETKTINVHPPTHV